MGLLDDAKSGVSKWFEEQVAKNKAFKAAGGMVKSNPAMTRSMGLLPATGLLEQEGDAAARADAAYGALRKEYGPLGLRPGDFVPFASGGLAIDDARLAAAKGNYGQAAGSLAGVIPVAGAFGKVVRKITGGKSSGVVDSVKREIFAGPNAKTANKAAINRFETEADRRMAAAQRNAALPFEQGGLGLPAGNTPMDRARAMGFDVDNPVYHGTGADFPNFRGSTTGKTSGSGVFFTENPSVASTYASSNGGSVIPAMLRTESPVQVSTNGANWNRIKKDAKVNAPRITVADAEGDKLMAELFGDSSPVSIQKKAFKKTVGNLFPEDFKYDDHISTDDLARWANKEGYDSISFDSIKDRGPSGVFANTESALPSKNTAAFDPKNIRSRFAAFDPMRRNESDLLALNGQKTGSGLLNPEITKATNRGLYRIMLDDEEDKPSFPYGLIGK